MTKIAKLFFMCKNSLNKDGQPVVFVTCCFCIKSPNTSMKISRMVIQQVFHGYINYLTVEEDP